MGARSVTSSIPGTSRALGMDSSGPSTHRHVSPQMAKCPCGSRLEFGTGAFGQTIERCTSATCQNRFAHHPVPDMGRPNRRHTNHIRKHKRK